MAPKDHILVVDDNLNNLQLCAKILREKNYNVSLAEKGSSAFLVIDQQKPDLILLDVMMPEIDGYQVCRKLKSIEATRDIPVIFLTARNDMNDLLEGFNAGGIDYITKPFNQQELLVRVSTHLELSKARKKIVEMNKTKEKLYSIISHDLRSPLSGIVSTISAINDQTIDKNDELFDILLLEIEKNTKNLFNLLDNLLEWTRFQNGSIQMKLLNTPINPIIQECIEILNNVAKEKNISIEADIEESISAKFDEVTMHTVFRNLLSNAIKFTPQNGRITISAFSDKDTVSISFRDTGVGMPTEVLDKIFNHNRHHTSLGSNMEKGTGLGLFIVKDFIQKNEGILHVTSTLGQGTEFVIKLPIEC